ncbi:MAG: NAD(P)H-hydrate dehydratase [Ferruginibacter sp.]
MKIFSALQIKEWDAYTIAHTPITSLNLMERAAVACFKWIQLTYGAEKNYTVFCGTGNNAGDGLALARMMYDENISVNVFIVGDIEHASADFLSNLERLKKTSVSIQQINSAENIPELPTGIIIDCIFGTGLNKSPEGIYRSLIGVINQSGKKIISIDMPSGLFADKTSKGNTVINATHTLTFQSVKLAFLMAENESYVGEMHVLDIGLDEHFSETEKSNYFFTEENQIKKLLRPRKLHAHKGVFGHALLIGGSHGKMGALILSSKACLRSGVGLLTVSIPESENSILQTTVPEAMTETNELAANDLEKYTAFGIGPGWGTDDAAQKQLHFILQQYKKPVVLDADALNCLSLNKEWLKLLPTNSIITPHPKEFERLFGRTENDFARLELARQQAALYKIFIVLKGHYTAIITPDGEIHFNSTGNAGMAKGGSGDVLTGIITGLLAQGYSSKDAVLLGAYLHGLAGDIAALEFSQEAMTASDIIHKLSKAFRRLNLNDKAPD